MCVCVYFFLGGAKVSLNAGSYVFACICMFVNMTVFV